MKMTRYRFIKVLLCICFGTNFNMIIVCKAQRNPYALKPGISGLQPRLPFRPGIYPPGSGVYPPGSGLFPPGSGIYPPVPGIKPDTQPIRGFCNFSKDEQPTKSIRFEKHRRSTCPPKTTVCTPEEEKRLSGFNHNLHLCCAKPTGPIKTRSLTICCDGWVYENDTCKPICRRGCINGYCASPGVCKCNPSLVLIDDNTCGEPTCDPPCFNAACTDNNVCSCFASHISYNKTHCVPQCEPGLFIDFISLTCEPPTCDSPCENGECTAPGVCTCNEGYTNLNDSTCIPICEPNCVNGICISPNTCSCEIGYESKNKTYCAPKCEACENGECVAPNQCECKVGYSKKDSDKCTPDCNKECVNATCVSPNKCVCASGYEPTDDDAVCKPKCYACKHGDCIAPLNCQCHDGYFRGVGGCIPECPEPCVNGKCTSPNICTCDDGYMKNSTHATVCFKPCEGLCEYGKCSLHGECICDRGYELRNGSCFSLIPVECSGCEYNCTFGECFCSNNTPCTMDFGVEGGLTRTEKTTSLAGLELTWILCGIVMLLLVVIVVLVMQAIWQRRKQFEKTQRCEGNTYSSVLFTTSDTLMQKKIPEEIPEEEVTLGSQSSETITIEKQQQSQLS